MKYVHGDLKSLTDFLGLDQMLQTFHLDVLPKAARLFGNQYLNLSQILGTHS